ncbi:MAG TPA: phosphatase PAP2 family protein [Longimicrobium sp.]
MNTPRHAHEHPERGPLRPLLSGIGRWVGGFYTAIGAFFLLAMAVMLAGVAAFAAIADAVSDGETEALDRAILLSLNKQASPRLDDFAMNVTALGSGLVVGIVVAVASVYLWGSRHRYSAVLLWVALSGSWILSSILKAFFNRARPNLFPWRTPHAFQASFPSGHSITAMVGYATLAYLVARLLPQRGLRWFTVGVAATIVALVGWSRMYLGVHWPSDVLGGYATGLAWASFCGLGLSAVRYFRYRRPELVAEEKDLEK